MATTQQQETSRSAAEGRFAREYEEVSGLLEGPGRALVSHRHPASGQPGLPGDWTLTYTVGLTALGRAELAVETRTPQGGREALNRLMHLAAEGAPPLRAGQLVTVPGVVLRAELGAPLGWFPQVQRRYTFARVALLRSVR